MNKEIQHHNMMAHKGNLVRLLNH